MTKESPAPPRRLDHRRPIYRRPAVLAVVAIAVVFLALWGRVLVGQRDLIGSDVLYTVNPWASEPAAHQPRNPYVGDPVVQFVPWLTVVKPALGRGDLPVWNPRAMTGAPLLANDQSSPLSPFTLFASLFDPKRGLSLAMLLKLWVAGAGTFVFLRALRVRPLAAVLGGLAYATSSFMTVWMGYPHTGVASVLPWVFAGVEWYLVRRRPIILAGLAAAVAVQFLAGHAQTSLHLGFAVGLYLVARLPFVTRRWSALAAIGAAAVLGVMLSSVQVIPFVAEVRNSSFLGSRTEANTGHMHLPAEAATTWLLPNGKGSPGVDRHSTRTPVYPESTGFAGVGALTLAVFAIGSWRRRQQWPAVGAMMLLAAVSAGIVYGPLSWLAGRMPLLRVANNMRLLVVLCFSVAVLAAVGFDRLLQRPNRAIGNRVAAAAVVPLTLLVGAAALLGGRWKRVNDLLHPIHGYSGFWLMVAFLSIATAIVAVAGLALGGRRIAPAVIVGLAIVEAGMFTFPYNPREPPSQVPPPSQHMTYLASHAQGRVGALGLDMLPNLATVYGLEDVRGVDVLIPDRVTKYWSAADPKYVESYFYTVLFTPRVRWLAAAGVDLFLTPDDKIVPGSQPVFAAHGMTIARVPGTRPFAFAAGARADAATPAEAATLMGDDPLRGVVVETPHTAPAPYHVLPRADVRIVRRHPAGIRLAVDATGPTTVVVLQSYHAGWRAEVDGRGAAIHPADILFQAIDVPAGHHVVDLTYAPSSVRYGILLSLVGVVLLAMFVAGAVWYERHPWLMSRATSAGDITHPDADADADVVAGASADGVTVGGD